MKTILSLCPIATVDKHGVFGRVRYEQYKFGGTRAEFKQDLGLIEYQGALYYGSLYRVPESLPLSQPPYYAELEPYLAQAVLFRDRARVDRLRRDGDRSVTPKT